MWASITYGTILCDDCAFRHITKGDEGKYREIVGTIKAFDNSDWTLCDIIALIEGGNGRMLQAMEKKILRRGSNEGRKECNRRESMLVSGNTEIKTDYQEAQCRTEFDSMYGSKEASIYRKSLSKKVVDICRVFECSGALK